MNKDNLIQLTNYLYKLTLLFPKKEPLRYKMRDVGSDILTNLITLESLNEYPIKEDQGKTNRLTPIVQKDLQILDAYFKIAYEQNWASLAGISEIKNEYDKIQKNLQGNHIIDNQEQEDLQSMDFSIQKAESIVDSSILKENPVPAAEKVEEDLPHDFFTAEKREHGFTSLKQEIELGPRVGKILEFMNDKDRVQVGEVVEIFPGVSKRTVRRDFQKLLLQGKIERIGEGNETFYCLKRYQS